MNRRPLIFLDVDGVLAIHGHLEPVLVANLDRIVRAFPDLEIVLNSAWNAHGMASVRNDLAEAGFSRPEVLIDRTEYCHGGGELVRQWMYDVPGRVGRPYVAIDDSTHAYDACLARLAWCPAPACLSEAVADQAIAILRRPPTPEGERRAALAVIDQFDAFPRPWLNDVERSEVDAKHAALRARLEALPADEFMAEACLDDQLDLEAA